MGDDWAFKDGNSCHKAGENHPCKYNNKSFYRQPFTSIPPKKTGFTPGNSFGKNLILYVTKLISIVVVVLLGAAQVQELSSNK